MLVVIIAIIAFGVGGAFYYKNRVQKSGLGPAQENHLQLSPLAPGSSAPASPQSGSGEPPECIGKKATSQNLPESCKIWFSLPQQPSPREVPTNSQDRQSFSQQPYPKDMFGGFGGSQTISVKFTGANYKIVFSKPSSGDWFTTGQNADIVLSAIDFNNTGSPLLFNHPGTVASDGTHLFLADRNNNRVLIWNKMPTGNTPPDLVLGQKDFTTNNPGTGFDQMNWPVSVSAAGGKIVVTDTYNNRILIWTNFPTKNGQPADLVINSAPGGLNAPRKRNIQWPWGAWTDGKKLAITSTSGGLVLLWNAFPTHNDQAADIYLSGPGAIGTPRTITNDCNHLVVSDHNAKVAVQYRSSFGSSSGPGNFFWKNWPTKDDEPYDFFMSDPYDPRGAWMQGGFTTDGKLILLGVKLHIWNFFPPRY